MSDYYDGGDDYPYTDDGLFFNNYWYTDANGRTYDFRERKPSDEEMYKTVYRIKPRKIVCKPAKGYYSYRCICGKNHDYRFFEADWKDKRGNNYKAGWYDENNNRYDGASLEGATGAACICGYCNQRCTVSINDHNVTQYTCPNCRSIMNIVFDKEDELKELTGVGVAYRYYVNWDVIIPAIFFTVISLAVIIFYW